MAEEKVIFNIADDKTMELSTGKIAKLANGSCRSDIIINYVNNIYIRYYHYAQKTKEK